MGIAAFLYAMITNDAKTGVLFGRIKIMRLCDYGLMGYRLCRYVPERLDKRRSGFLYVPVLAEMALDWSR